MSKTVLITGAAKRIGKAIALDMAKRGHRIALHYRSSKDEAEATAKECLAAGAEDAKIYCADLTDSNAIYTMISDLVKDFGKLDMLICSAAVFRKTEFNKLSEDDFDFHISANLKSTYLLAIGMSSQMNKDGVIITFGDWSGIRPYKNYLPYCVSKAAVISLTKALAQELAPDIRVNCICPGTILPPEDAPAEKIEQIENATPLGRIGKPEDILAAVHYLTEGSDFTTGVILPVDGGRLVSNSDLY
ncbi:MAG: SDR family oxidoreductase [Lentisphaeria bacterium]|nr:SDR family oxidoreductase [Lentisphaeria bacterium]NQZ66706.1 SDR family oxidoreductase [Lentisphaeria bacterium]